jgi:hypothetical protein
MIGSGRDVEPRGERGNEFPYTSAVVVRRKTETRAISEGDYVPFPT